MIAQTQFTISDLSDAIAEVVIGTQTASTAAWTGNASFKELKDGQTILYWLPYAGNTSYATLNLRLADGSQTGPVFVYINGKTRCSNQVAVGNITLMTYRENTPIGGSGSYTGWWINRNQDTTTNYFDRINYKNSVTAAEAIPLGRIGVFNSNGKLIKLSTTPFDVTKPILYAGTNYTANGSHTDNYIAWGTPFSLANTVSGFSGTAGQTVYIKGTLNSTMLTPVAGVATTTIPTTEDGYTYMLLGLLSGNSTVNITLPPEHPMFRYHDGAFKSISQISYEATVAASVAQETADAAQEAIDNLAVGGRNYILNSLNMILEGTHGLIKL